VVLSQHPEPQIRTNAIKMLYKKAHTRLIFSKKVKSSKGKLKLVGKNQAVIKQRKIEPDANSTAKALLPRFADDDANVIVELLSPKLKNLLKVFTKETLAKCLMAVIKRNASLKSTRSAARHLCGVGNLLTDDDAELKREVSYSSINQLIVTDELF
jgi:hypothetical protein